MRQTNIRSDRHRETGNRRTASAPPDPAGQGTLLHYLKATLISVILGEMVTMLLLLLFSFLICSVSLPQTMLDVLVVVAGAAGALVAGYLIGRLLREKGLLFGAVCGGIQILILFLLNIGFHQPSTLPFLLCRIVVILLCAMAGGIAGVNKRSRKVRL